MRNKSKPNHQPEEAPAMNSYQMNTPMENPVNMEDYFREFLLELDRKITRMSSFRIQEADDFKSYCCLFLMERTHLMSKYAPRALVSACASQRAVDFYRAMHRQMPQRKFRSGENASDHGIIFIDQPIDRSENSASYGDRIESNDHVEDQVINKVMLGSMLQNLSKRQRQVYLVVDIEGDTVVKAAKDMGIRREVAQRELGKARKIVAELREGFAD